MKALVARTGSVALVLVVVLFAWLPLRLWRVLAPAGQLRLVVLEDPAEALTDVTVRRGWRSWKVAGSALELERQGDSVAFSTPGGTRWTVGDEADGSSGELVFQVPWSVVSHYSTPGGEHAGWRRLDIGADPVGAQDPLGVRDLLVLDPQTVRGALPEEERSAFARTLGWARLLPADGEMFRRDDDQLRLAAELSGLQVQRGAAVLAVPEPGVATLLVEDGDILQGTGVRLRLRLTDETGSERLSLADGRVVYVPTRRRVLSFVSLAPRDLDGRPSARITAVGASATRSWHLGSSGAVRFVGLDQLLGRTHPGPIPSSLPDREFVAATREAFAVGAAYDHGGFVALHDEPSLESVLSLRREHHMLLADYGALEDPRQVGGPAGLLEDIVSTLEGAEKDEVETLLARHDELVLERLLAMDQDELETALSVLRRLHWGSGARLDSLVEQYNRRLDPAALGLGLDEPGDPLSGWEVSADGGERWSWPERWVPPAYAQGLRGADSLVWAWFPEPWRPQDLAPGATLERRFRRSLAGATELSLVTPTPVQVRVDGEVLAELSGDRRQVQTVALPCAASSLELVATHPSAVVRTVLPPGLRLSLMTRGSQQVLEATGSSWRFSGWELPEARSVRRSRWQPLQVTDGWLRLPQDRLEATPVETRHTAGPEDTGQAQQEDVAPRQPTLVPGARWYALTVDVPGGGPATLELAAMGDLTELYLNAAAVPITVARGETGGGAATVSLQLRRGRNTLAVATRPLRTASDGDAELDVQDGVSLGVRLASTTVSAASTRSGQRGAVLDGDAASLPRWVVERGWGALEAGTPVLIRRGGEGPQERLLWFPGAVKGWHEVMAGPRVAAVWTGHWRVAHKEASAGRYFHLDRATQLHPYAIRLPRGQGATLDRDRESVLGAGYRAEAVVGHHRRLDAELVAVGEEGPVQALRLEGEAALTDPGVGLGLRVYSDGDVLTVKPVGASRLIHYALGQPPRAVPADGLQVAVGDRVELADLGVLLRLDDPRGRLVWGPARARRTRAGLGLDGLLAPGGALGLEALLSERLATGRDVRTTLDDDLQAAVREELARQIALLDALGPDEAGRPRDEALAVVLDADTGALLAVVTDPPSGPGEPQLAYQDPRWHPGSTFKPVTAAAALASADPDVRAMVRGRAPQGFTAAGSLERMKVPALWGHPGEEEALTTGVPLRNFRSAAGSPGAGLQGALVASHNTWFGYLSLMLHRGWRQGWQVGGLPAGVVDRGRARRTWGLLAIAERVGFNRTFDLAPAASSVASRTAPSWSESGVASTAGDVLVAVPGRFPRRALGADGIATAGVGQGEVWATPLAMALVQATVAADGVRPAPRLVGAQHEGERLLSVEDARTLRRALAAVVQEGTGRTPFADNPRSAAIAGKTGSAERPGPGGVRLTDSWFTGSVRPPRYDPDGADPGRHRLAFAVLIPRGGLGSRQAGEAADRITKVIARRYGW